MHSFSFAHRNNLLFVIHTSWPSFKKDILYGRKRIPPLKLVIEGETRMIKKLFINCPKEERNKEILYLFHKDETIIQTIKSGTTFFFFFFILKNRSFYFASTYTHMHRFDLNLLYSPSRLLSFGWTHTHNETMISNWLQCATIYSPFFPPFFFWTDSHRLCP
jgi:hypothetical protein